MATPNLEQFHLDGVKASWHIGSNSDPAEFHLWPSLCKLKLGPRVQLHHNEAMYSGYGRFLPLFTSSLRSIEILSSHQDVAPIVLSNFLLRSSPFMAPTAWTPEHGNPPPQLRNLEVFRCIPSVSTRILKPFLEPAASSGSLKVLELGAPLSLNDIPSQPTTEYSFALSDNIHTLGLHDFNFYHDPSSRFGTTSQFDGQPFLDWLECFPKLHTVAVYPGQWEGVASFIMKLIMHSKVKVIHQEYLKGVEWDEAKKLAKKHGVEMKHTPLRAPIEWQAIEDGDD